jgi:hypothetical protein
VPLTYMPYFFVPNQFAPATGATSGTAPPAGGTAPAGGTTPAAGTGPAPAAAKAKGTVYLPGPEPGGSMAYANNQLSSVILVPVSTLFPLKKQTASSTNS